MKGLLIPLNGIYWEDFETETDGRGRMVSCKDMLPFLVPKRLVAQEKKMETALLHARGMNFALGNRVLKHEHVHWDVLGS